MGGTETKRRLGGFTDAEPARPVDALADGLEDGLTDPLGAGGPSVVADDVARTAGQLARAVGAPGRGEVVGETPLDGVVETATAAHAEGLDGADPAAGRSG